MSGVGLGSEKPGIEVRIVSMKLPDVVEVGAVGEEMLVILVG